jgi:hypothetical protein
MTIDFYTQHLGSVISKNVDYLHYHNVLLPRVRAVLLTYPDPCPPELISQNLCHPERKNTIRLRIGFWSRRTPCLIASSPDQSRHSHHCFLERTPLRAFACHPPGMGSFDCAGASRREPPTPLRMTLAFCHFLECRLPSLPPRIAASRSRCSLHLSTPLSS